MKINYLLFEQRKIIYIFCPYPEMKKARKQNRQLSFYQTLLKLDCQNLAIQFKDWYLISIFSYSGTWQYQSLLYWAQKANRFVYEKHKIRKDPIENYGLSRRTNTDLQQEILAFRKINNYIFYIVHLRNTGVNSRVHDSNKQIPQKNSNIALELFIWIHSSKWALLQKKNPGSLFTQR